MDMDMDVSDWIVYWYYVWQEATSVLEDILRDYSDELFTYWNNVKSYQSDWMEIEEKIGMDIMKQSALKSLSGMIKGRLRIMREVWTLVKATETARKSVAETVKEVDDYVMENYKSPCDFKDLEDLVAAVKASGIKLDTSKLTDIAEDNLMMKQIRAQAC